MSLNENKNEELQDYRNVDNSDFLDDIINLEKNIYEESLEKGQLLGDRLGKEEGYQFGISYGRKIGEEIGETLGFCFYLKKYLNSSTNNNSIEQAIKEKLLITIQQIEDIINNNISWEEPGKTNLEEILENLRNKKKLLEIRLKKIVTNKNVTNAYQTDNYTF
ncbi:hypothetical protein ABK040_003493 [Willaertia magna]